MASLGSQISTIVEAALVIINLALFSYGYPDASRTALWEEGGSQGFNSDPKTRIYFYANYLTPPEIPFIWSQAFSDSNLGVSILTLLLFVTRTSVRYVAGTNRCTEFFMQCSLFFFWVLCLAGQLSPDYSDEQHPSRSPWYLTHTCSVAQIADRTACRVAQASFGFSILTTLFYGSSICIMAVREGYMFLTRRERMRTKERKVYNIPYEMDSMDQQFRDDCPLMYNSNI